jgi:hypothetical protein
MEILKKFSITINLKNEDYKKDVADKIKNFSISLSQIDDETKAVLSSLNIEDVNKDGKINSVELVSKIQTDLDKEGDNYNKVKQAVLEAGKKLSLFANKGYAEINAQEVKNTELGNLSLVTRIVNETIFNGKGFERE